MELRGQITLAFFQGPAHRLIRRYCLPKGQKQLMPNLDCYQCIGVAEGGFFEDDFLENQALTSALNSLPKAPLNQDALATMAA